MITDAIITAFLGCLNALFSLIPTWSLPVNGGTSASEVGTGFNNVAIWSGYVAQGKALAPVDTITEILLAYFALKLVLATWSGIVFVYHQFWGSA